MEHEATARTFPTTLSTCAYLWFPKEFHAVLCPTHFMLIYNWLEQLFLELSEYGYTTRVRQNGISADPTGH